MHPYRQNDSSQLPLFSTHHREAPSHEPATYRIPLYRVTLVREAAVPARVARIGSSSDAAAIVREYLAEVDREHFVVLLLNRKNGLIGMNIVSVGSVTGSIVHPREVFKPAIVGNAVAMVCAHNHPSGDPRPSAEDRGLTARLVEAGKLLGIDVLDHVIIGDGTSHYFSFADQGLLTTGRP